MRLLVDNQLPAALAAYLCTRGHNRLHVLDLRLEEATDLELWAHCADDGSVLISKDEDFVILANRPGDTRRLVWVRLGNCRNAALLSAFDRIHDTMVGALDAGQRIFEVR